jgi:hypothetical protein
MRDFKIYLSIASILMVVYLVAEYNKPVPVNWSPTLYYNDKVPFGTYIFYQQLKQIYPGANVIKTNGSIYKVLHDTTTTPGNYLVIAKNVTMNKADFNELTKYIKAGNSVFLSALSFSGVLADTLDITTSTEFNKGNATLNFENPRLKQANNYNFSRDISNKYFSDFDTTKATVIGRNNYGHTNYLSFAFGKGKLYLCANPLIFSNYGLLTGQGADYAAKALSYLPVTTNVYWDEYQNGDIEGDESPMRVFFGNPNLQWAYYLSLFGMIVFVLYEMKRRQRIIPVIEPLKNSTVEFVNVVGQVYYEKRDNANIAHKNVLYFLSHVRDEYRIKTNKLDKEFIENLTTKLNLDPLFATQLVNYLQYLSVQTRVDDHELIELNKLIEQFYIKSR